MISIIIPVLNEEKTIGRLITHLKNSSAGFLTEIIVADGGSTDRTLEIAREKGASTIRCESNGRGVQMNEGAALASGKILYFIHADTLPPKGYDQFIHQAFKTNCKAGCFRLRFDDDHWALRFYSWFTRFETTLVRFGDQSLFVEKNLFKKVGGFDESLTVMEDQEIIRRLKKQAPFRVLADSVITSSRKYRDNGVFRLQFTFVLIFTFYYAGISQKTLVHLYKTLIQNSRI